MAKNPVDKKNALPPSESSSPAAEIAKDASATGDAPVGKPREATLRSFLQRIWEGPLPDDAPPWPADAFGVAAVVLQRLGGYHRVVEHPWPPHTAWLESVDTAAETWFKAIDEADWRQMDAQIPSGIKAPDLVEDAWNEVMRSADSKVMDLGYQTFRSGMEDQDQRRQSLFENLITILAVSDATFGRIVSREKEAKSAFTLWLRGCAVPNRTFAISLDREEVRVLPKVITPSVGLSLRSLSHYLSVWTDLEVEPVLTPLNYSWIARQTSRKSRGSCLYFLLVPWPYKIDRTQFKSKATGKDEIELAEGYGFFKYQSVNDAGQLAGKIGALISESQSLVGRVDAVVLPEASMNQSDYGQIERYLASRVPLSIVGVHGEDFNRVNVAHSFSPDDTSSGSPTDPSNVYFEQDKHHRWKLDRGQLSQYQFGSQLDPDTEWWESHRIRKRQLNLINLDSAFMLTTLVCEDLARQDPVARLIRTVGPNLVIAILMDGPQVKGRWSDRYATILADDPGSSVLTLTSQGMVERARPPKGRPGSRSIALWRDHLSGVHELSLEYVDGGILLQLELTEVQQNTADRREPIRRLVPVLKDVTQLKGLGG